MVAAAARSPDTAPRIEDGTFEGASRSRLTAGAAASRDSSTRSRRRPQKNPADSAEDHPAYGSPTSPYGSADSRCYAYHASSSAAYPSASGRSCDRSSTRHRKSSSRQTLADELAGAVVLRARWRLPVHDALFTASTAVPGATARRRAGADSQGGALDGRTEPDRTAAPPWAAIALRFRRTTTWDCACYSGRG